MSNGRHDASPQGVLQWCAVRRMLPLGMQRCLSWLALPLVLWLCACSKPVQMGGVVLAPGAVERLRLAMRYGYQVEGIPRPAEVRVAVGAEQIPGGEARSGRVGDWVLDNGVIVAVVARVDGSPRSGRLVDLVHGWEGLDDLRAFDTRVLGQPVRYEVASSGRDEALGSAYVVVSGEVDLSDAGGPIVAVETRYDVAPALDIVLISTRVRVTKAAALPDVGLEVDDDAPDERAPEAWTPQHPTVEDRLRVRDATLHADLDLPQVAALGPSSGYALQPLDDATPSDAQRGMAFRGGDLAEKGDWVLYSRAVVSLERPDTLSAELAAARAYAEPLGVLEVRLIPNSRATRSLGRLDFLLDRPGKPRLTAKGIVSCGTEGLYRLSVPVGPYTLQLRGGLHDSREAVSVDVRPSSTTRVDVVAVAARQAYPTQFTAPCPTPRWSDAP